MDVYPCRFFTALKAVFSGWDTMDNLVNNIGSIDLNIKDACT
jgi:hypothetical protein